MKKICTSLICLSVFFSFSAYAEDRSSTRIKNQTAETLIFFPEKEIGEIFKAEKEGVLIPYKEYKSLYEKARQEYGEKRERIILNEDIKGPQIVQAHYDGSVQGDLLKVSVRYQIVQNDPEPRVLQLPFGIVEKCADARPCRMNAGEYLSLAAQTSGKKTRQTGVSRPSVSKNVLFLKATLNNENAHIYNDNKTPSLIIPSNGTFTLIIDFFIPINFKDKTGNIAIDIPPAMLGQVAISTDIFYDVRFKDFLLTSKKQVDDKMEFLGFLPSMETSLSFEITNRRSSGEKRVKIKSQEEHQAFLSEDLIEQTIMYDMDVENGEVDRVDIIIAKDLNIYDISGSIISNWSRESKEDTDILHLYFHVPLSTGITFALKTYQYPDAASGMFTLADVRVENLFERKGILAVFYDDSMRINARQVDFLLPLSGEGGVRRQHESDRYVLFREYHVFNLPYKISFSQKDVPLEVTLFQNNEIKLEHARILFQSEVTLSGITEEITRFNFQVPDKYVLRNLDAFLNGEVVNENHRHFMETGELSIDIRNPVNLKDEITFLLTFERILNEKFFMDQSYPIAIPAITYLNTKKMIGSLQVIIDEEFLLEDIILKGYYPALEMMTASSSQTLNKNLLYDFRTLSPEGSLVLSYRKAEQTTQTITYVAVDQDLLQTNAYIKYDITAGKKDHFYFAIPRWEDSKINIEGLNIKEKKKISEEKLKELLKDPLILDLKDYDIWNVVLQKEIIGSYSLEIDYQKKIEKFDVLTDIPLIIPLDIINDTGYIVLEASKNTEIDAQKVGLNDIEIYEIPQWPSYKPSNRIIESLRYFTRPFTFRIAVRRMDETPVLSSIAERETIVYTFGEDSDIFFKCDYVIRNTNLQFLEIQLPKRFVLWGATLKGQGIKPRKGNDNRLFVPLPTESDQNIHLSLTGQMVRKGKFRAWESFDFQSPRLSIPCLQSNTTVYFPEKYSLLNIGGNFEKYPEAEYHRPLLFLSLKDLCFFIGGNAINLFSPGYISRGLQGRIRSVNEDIGDQFAPGNAVFTQQGQVRDAPQDFQSGEQFEGGIGATMQYEPYYLESNYEVTRDREVAVSEEESLEEQMVNYDGRQQMMRYERKYSKKKGILSLNIDIPREGQSLAAYKLWGNSRLQVTFISDVWKRVFHFCFLFLFIVLGFHVKRKKIMSSFMFLVLTLVVCTLIPLVVLKSFLFIFNGAALGAIAFVFILGGMKLVRKFAGKFGFYSVLFCLVALTGFACPRNGYAEVRAGNMGERLYSPDGCCPDEEENDAFPSVRVYIPYSENFLNEIQGHSRVYIPTQDYFRLKFLAEPPYEPKDTFKFENEYDITGLFLAGELQTDRIQFAATVDIFINNDKWILVDLPFKNVFIEKLTLDGQSIPVKVKQSGPGCFESFFKSAEPYCSPGEADLYEIPVLGRGHHSVDLIFFVEIQSSPGKKTLSFGLPPALFSDFSLDLKRKDVFLEFEKPNNSFYLDESGVNPVVKASLSRQSELKLSWFPKKYLKKTEKPLIYADCNIDMLMGYEEIIIVQETKIRVEKSSIASLSFFLEPDIVIVDVFSNKVKNWQTRQEKGQSVLDVIFKHEITDTVDIVIKAKRNVRPDTVSPVIFLKPQTTKRIHGTLNLFASEEDKLIIENVTNLNPAGTTRQHQQGVPGMKLLKSYSFLTGDFSARIEKVPEERKVAARMNSQHVFSENLLNSTYDINLNIKKNFLTAIQIILPRGQKIDAIHAENTSDYSLQDNILVLPFKRAVKGKYRFQLKLEREIDNFSSAAIESIQLPDVQKVTGASVVLFPRGYDVKEVSVSGLRSANINTVTPLIKTDQGDYGAKYAYVLREKNYTARYNIFKKDSSLDVIKIYHSTVKDNLVSVKLLSIFNIKNAPVDHFDIIVPVDLKDSIEIQGEGIQTILKKVINEGKSVAITVNTIAKIDHSYMLQVSFNRYFGNDKTFHMPRIVFPQAKNKTEFIAVEADTVYHVESFVSESLYEAEPDRIPALPDGIDLNKILWSYQSSGSAEWQCRLELKRLEREKLVKAKILREDIKTLLIPNGHALHQIEIKINNRTLQFLPVHLPSTASLWSLKVAGENVRASLVPSDKKGQKKYLIPLIKSGVGDRSFDIKLIYITPLKELGLFGRINLSNMIKTGDVPVEKTTWSVFVPDNYSYFYFRSNLDESDISIIEAEKTLELAKEYKYWTDLASSTKGGLREKALDNRKKVMKDYGAQYSSYQRVETDLAGREGDNTYNQGIIHKARSQNTRMLDEASKIVEYNKADSRTVNRQLIQSDKKAMSGRRNVKGWQIKTNDFGGEDQVEQSITNYLQQEDLKQSVKGKGGKDKGRKYSKSQLLGRKQAQSARQKKDMARSSLKGRARQQGGYQTSQTMDVYDYEDQTTQTEHIFYKQSDMSEGKMIVNGLARGAGREKEESGSFWGADGSAPAPIVQIFSGAGNKMPIQQQQEKRSTLLKGLRSIDIPIPEQGIRYSYKKLGGNPQIKFYYRRKGSLLKICLLLMCMVAVGGIYKFRQYRFPKEKLLGVFKGINPVTIVRKIIDSQLLRIVIVVLIVPTFFMQSPICVVLVGLSSVFLLTHISKKRYRKIGYVPVYSFIIFLKYFISYAILLVSFLSFFHMSFLFLVGVGIFFNVIWIVIYSIVTLCTKKVVLKNPENSNDEGVSSFSGEGPA